MNQAILNISFSVQIEDLPYYFPIHLRIYYSMWKQRMWMLQICFCKDSQSSRIPQMKAYKILRGRNHWCTHYLSWVPRFADYPVAAVNLLWIFLIFTDPQNMSQSILLVLVWISALCILLFRSWFMFTLLKIPCMIPLNIADKYFLYQLNYVEILLNSASLV